MKEVWMEVFSLGFWEDLSNVLHPLVEVIMEVSKQQELEDRGEG